MKSIAHINKKILTDGVVVSYRGYYSDLFLFSIELIVPKHINKAKILFNLQNSKFFKIKDYTTEDISDLSVPGNLYIDFKIPKKYFNNIKEIEQKFTEEFGINFINKNYE